MNALIPETKVIRSATNGLSRPFFSICIPQHNRTSFILTALRHLSDQTFRRFEVCISDDLSSDGRSDEIINFLSEHGLSFTFVRQVANQRYDRNLRTALSLATGEFCILMGNDDALARNDVLAMMHEKISANPNIGVVIPNFADYSTGSVCRRVIANRIVKGSPGTAVSIFRNLAFVSGIAFRQERVRANASTEVDGTEMYQMFLGCRILAEGYDLLEIDDALVLKDIKIPGEDVDHYTKWPKVRPCPIIERRLPMAKLATVVYAGIRPLAGIDLAHFGANAVTQILLFPYPYWILEYRRVQSWNYSAGLCIGMRPRNLTEGIALTLAQRVYLRMLFGLVTSIGLICPLQLFDAVRSQLHAFAKRRFRPEG